ncbi:MAG: phosphate ABC transporter substrate-binding/OmpA family protein [Candidatus Competibacteraceae bacterium]
MSRKHWYRCGTGAQGCPHAESGKPFAIEEDDFPAWSCPHSKFCKENLQPVSWADRNRGIIRALIVVIVLALLGGIAILLKHQVTAKPGVIKENGPSKQRHLTDVRNLPVSLRISSAPGLGKALIAPLVESYIIRIKNTSPQVEWIDDKAHIHWEQGTHCQQITVTELTDEQGFKALLAKDSTAGSDIHIAYRQPTPAELDALSSLGDLTSSECAQVIALDAVAVLVNSRNPVSTISDKSLDSLVTGKASNWIGVGGSNMPVTLYAPNPSGREAVVEQVFGDLLKTVTAKRVEASATVESKIGETEGSLGLAAFSTCSPRSKVLTIQAEEHTRQLKPSPFTIATEDYKYSVRIIAYHAKRPVAEVAPFIKYVTSKEGQAAVSRLGFVDQNIRAAMDKNDEIIAAALAEAVRPHKLVSAERLSTNLRFEVGKSDLDLKARADVSRVVERLADPDLRERRLAILGFADIKGNDAINFPLSEDRAKRVAQEFKQRGVFPKVILGLGSRLPVDSNDTEQGRQRNRRVELWVLQISK